MTARLRIGYFAPGNGTGGPWRYVHSLLNALDYDRYEPIVFCDISEEWVRPGVRAVPWRTVRANVSPASVPLQPPRVRPLRVWAGFAQECRRLANIFRPWKLDLLHTQNAGCEESPVAARLAGIRRVIGTFHVDPSYDLDNVRSGPTHRLLEILSNRCLSLGIGVSRAAGRAWVERSRFPAARLRTIHNGIDANLFQRCHTRTDARKRWNLPEHAFLVGGVGRLDPAKGFDTLIDAVAELPNVGVVLAGEGPMRPELERRIAAHGMADRVHLLGFQSDIPGVLETFDLFALPSRCENLSYALLEAMALGLPCIGSSVGGTPEVIVAGQTGLLVPSRRPDLLRHAIIQLQSDRPLSEQMGRVGQQRVLDQFREDRMCEETLKLYAELCPE